MKHKKFKSVFIVICVIALSLVVYGVYNNIVDVGALPQQEQPNLPNFDTTKGEPVPYLLSDSYDSGLNDFVLPRLTETRGLDLDLSLDNYANFVVYSSSGVNDTRGLIQTADYQMFTHNFSNGYRCEEDEFFINSRTMASTYDAGFYANNNKNFFMPANRSIGLRISNSKVSVCNLNYKLGRYEQWCVFHLSTDYHANIIGEQVKFEQYSDDSYFVIGDNIYKMTYKNGYLKTMDALYKAVVSKYTTAKNGDTYANYLVLNGLVDVYKWDNGVETIIDEQNVLMPFSVSYCSRTNCDDKFVLSDNMNLILS